jgi:plasmid stability protein
MQPDMSSSATVTLTVRNLDRSVRDRLRLRAARHGRSMEAELRSILQTSLEQDAEAASPSLSLADKIHQRFADCSTNELPVLPRQSVRPPPHFDE